MTFPRDVQYTTCSAVFSHPVPNLPLSYLTVTVMIDETASLDYRLVGAPQVTSEGLDTPFKVRGYRERTLLGNQFHFPEAAPPLPLPAHKGQMCY